MFPLLFQPTKQRGMILIPIDKGLIPSVLSGRIDMQLRRNALSPQRIIEQGTVSRMHQIVVVAEGDETGRCFGSDLLLRRIFLDQRTIGIGTQQIVPGIDLRIGAVHRNDRIDQHGEIGFDASSVDHGR